MLEMYYDFLVPNLGRENFALCEMDTDSLYFAISGDTLEETVSSNLTEAEYAQFLKTKDRFLCNMDCSGFRDKFTPSLFKLEYLGSCMVGLNAKTHVAWLLDQNNAVVNVKRAQKGVSKKRSPFEPGYVVHFFCKVLVVVCGI
jgi:hypothetical protein